MKAGVDKLDINKLFNVPNSFNNLKTKIDDLDVGKLKTVLAHLKKLSDAVVNILEKKILDLTTLIHLNQDNTVKQNLDKKVGDVNKKYQIQVI